MDPKIKAWLEAEEEVKRAKERCNDAHGAALMAPLPEKLRPAEPEDIKKGAIIWYPREDDFDFWKLVVEPQHYGDEWKAYVAEDGSRYGLRGAFVEIDEEHEPEKAIPPAKEVRFRCKGCKLEWSAKAFKSAKEIEAYTFEHGCPSCGSMDLVSDRTEIKTSDIDALLAGGFMKVVSFEE